MSSGGKIVSAQLRLGDAEPTSHGEARITAAIDAAQKLAGLNRLLFLPTYNAGLNTAVIEHCQRRGIEIYLWYKVLADNNIIADNDELVENAWGRKGIGESGVWQPIFNLEETYLFGCPRNQRYNNLLLNRCRQQLSGYDGLFVDSIGFPLPSVGLESTFSCFCPACREVEPRLAQWRRNVMELREAVVSATDADLEKWGTLRNVHRIFDLVEFFAFRDQSITLLTGRYAALAREMGKGVGIDVITPAMAMLSAHDYSALGKLADWLKPRIYFRFFGPSCLPLELYSLAKGMREWGKRYSFPAILDIIGRSTNLEMPKSIHSLSQHRLPNSVVRHEITAAAHATDCPIHPGLELSIHHEFETTHRKETGPNVLEAAKESPGLVMCWNLLDIPEVNLRRVGEAMQK